MRIAKPGPISSHAYLLGTLEFPCYWIQGERGALVDAGITAIAPFLEQEFGEGKRQPFFVVLTHSHYDHVGGLGVLRRLNPRLIVAASLETANLLSRSKVYDFILDMNRAQEVSRGLSEEGGEVPLRHQDLQVDMVLGQGDVLELGGGVALDVILTPGHTRCSTSYLLKPDSVLFGGDGLGALINENETGASFASSYKEYVSSLRKIQALSVRTLALPHQGVLSGDDARRHLEGAVTSADTLFQEILQLVDQGKPPKEIVERLFQKLHRGFAANEPAHSFRINLEAMVRVAIKERT